MSWCAGCYVMLVELLQ